MHDRKTKTKFALQNNVRIGVSSSGFRDVLADQLQIDDQRQEDGHAQGELLAGLRWQQEREESDERDQRVRKDDFHHVVQLRALQNECESHETVLDVAEVRDAFVADLHVGMNELPFSANERVPLDRTPLNEFNRVTAVSTAPNDDGAMLLIEREVGEPNFADRFPQILEHEANVA